MVQVNNDYIIKQLWQVNDVFIFAATIEEAIGCYKKVVTDTPITTVELVKGKVFEINREKTNMSTTLYTTLDSSCYENLRQKKSTEKPWERVNINFGKEPRFI